jgi:hypothetical protein
VTPHSYHLVSIVHASLGAALLAVLALSAWLDSRGEERSFGTGLAISSALQAAQAALGLVLERFFAQSMRPTVVLKFSSLAWWLDRKEHVAIAAAVLTWGALGAHVLASRPRGNAARSRAFRKAASRGARGAALCAFFAFTVGVVFAAGTSMMP